MLVERTRQRLFIGVGVLLALLLILQGVVRLVRGGMISLNYSGQPITAVGSILLGFLFPALLPFMMRPRKKNPRSRDR